MAHQKLCQVYTSEMENQDVRGTDTGCADWRRRGKTMMTSGVTNVYERCERPEIRREACTRLCRPNTALHSATWSTGVGHNITDHELTCLEYIWTTQVRIGAPFNVRNQNVPYSKPSKRSFTGLSPRLLASTLQNHPKTSPNNGCLLLFSAQTNVFYLIQNCFTYVVVTDRNKTQTHTPLTLCKPPRQQAPVLNTQGKH